MEIPIIITENLDVILIIMGSIMSILAFKLITKILFKLITICVILIGLFIGYQQFLGTNIIDDIQTLYCSENKTNKVKCDCFVSPIINNLESRFTPAELIELKTKKLKANTEFIKSYKIQENEIQTCFELKGESKGLLEEILKDIKEMGFNLLT